jgi:hypothetical protein
VALSRAPSRLLRRTRRQLATAVCLGVLAAAAPQAHAADKPTAAAATPAAAPPARAPESTAAKVAAGVIVIGALVLPSEIGLFLSGPDGDFLLGWSWQAPITSNDRHRVLAGFDWIPYNDARGRVRLGYRYGRNHVIVGLAASYARSGPTWSPEVGFRFGTDGRPAGHLLARAEIPAAFDGFQGVSLLLGWDLL